jgi:hypothetical protein
MKKLLIVIPLVLLTAGCETRAGNVATGAAIGAAVNDDNRLAGAAVGGAAGLLVSAIQEGNNQCRYRNTVTGEVYIATCP